MANWYKKQQRSGYTADITGLDPKYGLSRNFRAYDPSDQSGIVEHRRPGRSQSVIGRYKGGKFKEFKWGSKGGYNPQDVAKRYFRMKEGGFKFGMHKKKTRQYSKGAKARMLKKFFGLLKAGKIKGMKYDKSKASKRK